MIEPTDRANRPGEATRPERRRSFARLSGILFLAAGSLLLVPLVWSGWRNYRVRTQYRETACSIVGKRVRLSTSGSSSRSTGSTGSTTMYRPEFTARYDVEGRQLLADGYDSSGTSGASARSAEEVLSRFSLWKEYPCWYDPRNPGRFVLTRSDSTPYVAALGPLLAIGVGAFLLRLSRSMPDGPGLASAFAGPPGTRSPFRSIILIMAIGFPIALVAVVAVFVFVLVPGYRLKDPSDAERRETLAALEKGQPGMVRALVEGGVSPDTRDGQGFPMLIRALERCGQGAEGDAYGELAVFLIQRGADVNARSAARGRTPLATATEACPSAIVRTLVGAGARD